MFLNSGQAVGFPEDEKTPVAEAVPKDNSEKGEVKKTEEGDISDGTEEDSPFDIVKCSVSNKDDPTMYSLTFRVWFLGVIFTGVLSFVNQFFFYRQNQLSLGGSVVQLLAFPAGYV
ncbi:hypothetical protein GGI22_006049, partial [Coemansia erecta]